MAIFPFASLISFFWLVWLAYWIFSAFDVKKTAQHSRPWANGWLVRAAMVIVVIFILSHFGPTGFFNYNAPLWLAVLGDILCGIGLAFAIWARVHLGRNWSGVPSLKEDHELITSGPYRFVRHPIYTGIIVALLGTALVLSSVFWYFFFSVLAIMFIWRIPIEERLMMETFPKQYPEYKKRTKALMPFIW
jgi:protein-S-isoprenylcysteine O-methyltransferase Ste14